MAKNKIDDDFFKKSDELYSDEELIHFGKIQWGTYEGKRLYFSEIPESHLINIVDHISKVPTLFSKNFRDNVLNYALKIRKIPYSKILKGQIPHINDKGETAILEVDEDSQTARLKILSKTKNKKSKVKKKNLVKKKVVTKKKP